MKKEINRKSKLWIWLAVGIVAVLAVIGVILALLLPGGQSGPTTTGGKAELYWNVDRLVYMENAKVEGFSERTAAEDGNYYITFAYEGQQVELQIIDKQLVNIIDNMDVMGLVFDADGVVIDAVDPTTIATETAKGAFVQKVEDGCITVNTSQAMNGMTIELPITENTDIYDVTPTAELVGQIGEPQIMDQIIAYADENGEITHIYITAHPVDAGIYWRVKQMYDSEKGSTTREPDENGVYTIQFAHNGELVDVKCKSKEIVTNIDSKALLQGQFACLFDEEGYLIECVNVALSLRGTYLATDYHVTAIEGDTYTLTKLSSGNEQGRSMSITLAENCEIFNCCQWECFGHNCGEYTDHLNLYDRVNVYANLDGEAIMIFVTRRMIHDENLDLYFNYDRQYGGDATGTMRKPVGGYYIFEMLLDGKLKTVRVKDKAMADAIDKPYNKSLGLVVEGDIVTKVYNPSCVVGGANYANEIPVAVLSGPMVTFNYTNGTVRNFVMSGDCKVYNAITGEYGKKVGGEMTLQQGDVVVAFTDYKDELALVYVVSRPVEGAKVYYNLSRRYDSTKRETTREPNADGYYEFQFACEGKQVTGKTKSKGMATFIDSQSAPVVGLKINSSGIITNAYFVTAALKNATKVCNYHYVKDLNNKEKTFGTYYIIDNVRTDSTAVQKIADNCIIYNVSTSFENFRGEKGTLKNGDQIQGIKDSKTGEVIMIFIMQRDPTYGFESYKAGCSHCGKTVTWQPYGGNIAQADGHYYACGNFTLKQGNAGVKDDGKLFDIVLDLKGHSITSTARAFLVYDKLTILDSKGGGKVAGTTPSGDQATIGSTIMVMEGGELNLMGGTLTLSEKSTKFGTLGGVVYVQPKATMNMSGGSITGGTSDNGGNVYIGGTFNLSGGTISGGNAPLGQNISMAGTGTLNISGGTVDGGIYMGNGALTLSGKPVIGGTGLAVTPGKQISVKGLTKGASVVITGSGVFTEVLSDPGSYLAYFKANTEGDSIFVDGKALNYYKKPADYNSVDNGNLKFAAGTTNAYCPVCEKTVTWTALTAEKMTLGTGHYYLAKDLNYAGDKDANDFFLTAPGTGKTACLHLNGHSISCANNRVVQGSTGVLNILGNGTVSGGWKTGGWVTGGTVGINTSGASGTINLIGGTYVTTDANTPVLAITDNGGTISVYNGATVRGSGSGSVVHIGKATLVNANFNVFGGTIEGGVINMAGAQNDKGNTANLTIAGGKIPGGVIVGANSQIVLQGSPVVGEMNIPRDVLIDAAALTQGANITVYANGIFTKKLTDAETVKAFFTPVSSDDEIVARDGVLVYSAKKPAGGLELDENGYGMCDHCGESVLWTAVAGGLGTITDTSVHHHYYLSGDLKLASGALMSVNGKANVCLHLNGYTVTQKGWINVIQGTLSILNGNATTGGIIGNHDTYNTFNVSWGTLNIYGGTYSYAGSGDLSTIQLGQTSSKLNLYGGKINSGIDVNKGVLTLSKTATVTGAENELTDNIYVAAAGKLVVKSDYEGIASVKFESALTDNAVPEANGASEGAFAGKLYLETENSPEIFGEGTKLVLKTDDSGEEDDGDDDGEEEKPTGVLELDENGYAMCDHCGESVQWTAVTGGLGTVNDTSVHHHYYLTGNMTLSAGSLMLVNGKANVCLHLNGYTVTQKGWINVIQGTLSILNGNAETGGIIGTHDTYNTFNISWGTLNIYGGTYSYAGSGDLSTIQMGQTSSKLNLYGGKVGGGSDVNKGGLALSKTATVTGAENELTDNIYVAAAGKLIVKSDYEGIASVKFESVLADNAVPEANGASEGAFAGKLYLETETKPQIVGEGTFLVIVPVVGYELELDENGYGMCQHCNQSVQWTAVTGGLSTITDTTKHHHYYLTGNLTFGFGFFNVNSKANVCLHLNNFTVTQKGWINVIQGTLSVMDGTAGTGGIIGNSDSSNTFNVSWGTLNIYAGNYSYAGSGNLSTIQMGQTSSKLNVYGGKVVGGIDVNKGTLTIGGNAIIAGLEGELTDNIYIAATGKLVVKADYAGVASVAFESLTDNTISDTNGICEDVFTGKLYLEIAGTPAITGENGLLKVAAAE